MTLDSLITDVKKTFGKVSVTKKLLSDYPNLKIVGEYKPQPHKPYTARRCWWAK